METALMYTQGELNEIKWIAQYASEKRGTSHEQLRGLQRETAAARRERTAQVQEMRREVQRRTDELQARERVTRVRTACWTLLVFISKTKFSTSNSILILQPWWNPAFCWSKMIEMQKDQTQDQPEVELSRKECLPSNSSLPENSSHTKAFFLNNQ